MTTEKTQRTLVGISMIAPLARNWKLLLFRAFVSIAFGVMAFIWPKLTLLSLVLLFAAFALADGALALGAAIMGRTELGSRWWLLFVGITGILAGIVAFLMPGVTAWTFAVIVGFWSIATGAFEIVGAIRLRKEIEGEFFLIVAGIVNILFGMVLLLVPGLGLLTLIYLIGIYAIISGVALAAFAWRIRGLAST
jgi:uncharacterized membrane protein HdeD (DUF308 family)